MLRFNGKKPYHILWSACFDKYFDKNMQRHQFEVVCNE